MTEQLRNSRVPARGRRRLLAAWLLGGSLLMTHAVPLAPQGPPAEVEVGVTPQGRVFDAADGLRFRVTLRNTGAKALLLNGGLLLGNGRQAWQAITCALHPKTGAQIRLDLHWQVGPVGGRIYFLGVPLRPGDAHTLAVTAADYSQGTPIPPGQYRLQCAFNGRQSEYRDATQLPDCWEGVAVSTPVSIEIKQSLRQ